jgi:hypothetical protein
VDEGKEAEKNKKIEDEISWRERIILPLRLL